MSSFQISDFTNALINPLADVTSGQSNNLNFDTILSGSINQSNSDTLTQQLRTITNQISTLPINEQAPALALTDRVQTHINNDASDNPQLTQIKNRLNQLTELLKLSTNGSNQAEPPSIISADSLFAPSALSDLAQSNTTDLSQLITYMQAQFASVQTRINAALKTQASTLTPTETDWVTNGMNDKASLLNLIQKIS